MLAGTMTNGGEDEVQEEMERMEREEKAARNGKVVATSASDLKLPDVPKWLPVSQDDEEEVASGGDVWESR